MSRFLSTFALPVATIVFSIFFLIVSLSIPSAGRGVGPAAWPRAVLCMMLFLGTLLLIRELIAFQKKRALDAISKTAIETAPVEKEEQSYTHWISLGVICAYVLLMSLTGFLPATVLFIICLSRLLGMKNIKAVLLVSFISTLVMGYLFMNLLMMPMPRGIGFFRDFSYFFNQL